MKRNLFGGSLLAALATLILAEIVADPFSDAAPVDPVRVIELTARDVAFGGTNPTITASPGERVLLRIRNTDPGILHSITLPGIDSKVRHIAPGKTVEFEVTMPQAGSFEYVCPQHEPKMKGRIVVEEAGAATTVRDRSRED